MDPWFVTRRPIVKLGTNRALPLSHTRLRRRERNKMHAKATRERKKAYLESMEEVSLWMLALLV